MHNFWVCAYNSQDFAYSQENFAWSNDRETVTFRNSDILIRILYHILFSSHLLIILGGFPLVCHKAEKRGCDLPTIRKTIDILAFFSLSPIHLFPLNSKWFSFELKWRLSFQEMCTIICWLQISTCERVLKKSSKTVQVGTASILWRSNSLKASHQGTQEMNILELNVLMKFPHIALNLPKCALGS